MRNQFSGIMCALRSALRGALESHPLLYPDVVEAVVADVRQLDDILREFRVCIYDVERDAYGIMSPNHKDEDGEPFYVGAFVTLDWLDRYALSTPEEFHDAYVQLQMKQGICNVVTLPNGETSLKYFRVSYDDIE